MCYRFIDGSVSHNPEANNRLLLVKIPPQFIFCGCLMLQVAPAFFIQISISESEQHIQDTLIVKYIVLFIAIMDTSSSSSHYEQHLRIIVINKILLVYQQNITTDRKHYATKDGK